MGSELNNELDPEIANLLGIEDEKKAEPTPKFNKLFEQKNEIDKIKPGTQAQIIKKTFSKIEKVLSKPNNFFNDKDYYNKVLSEEGNQAKRFHELFTGFLKAQNPDDKSIYRVKVIPAFWDLLASVTQRIQSKLSIYKILLLRFAIVSPAFISPEQRNILDRVVLKNNTNEPIYYLDEWLKRVAEGGIKTSATDELKKVKQDYAQKMLTKKDKRKGQRDAEINVLRTKISQLEETEEMLLQRVKDLTQHDIRHDIENLKACYTPEQKKMISDISNLLRKLSIIDRDMGRIYNDIEKIDGELTNLDQSTSGIDTNTIIDTKIVVNEFNSIRQMSKLCVGRKGNHFPILMKNYFFSNVNEYGIRENVINTIFDVENLDSGLFIRSYKEQRTRIVPFILLLPNYGELGICWQPFDKYNKASSRGRLAIPIFTKNLKIAIVAALADLRWQVAKEKAQHYWMEEGITGRYYQWFQENKMKGDVKDAFIKDYILWITKESQGMQKLDKEVRGIFWRLMPFPEELKAKLRNRGFVYNELYKKDMNIARSDGY